jgi:signal transduction histidine kinase
MKARRRSKSERMLRRRAVLSAISIVIASVMAFGLVEFFTNVVLGKNTTYDPIDMIGMIGPMGVLMGLVSYATFRATNRDTSKLLAAIDRVADGDFNVLLNETAPGPYREVFANFTVMCEELQSIQTLRDDFINHFSHEFRTPITSINGFARLLIEENVPEEDRRKYLEIIASESERLADMSSNALIMTKLDSQQYILDKASYSLDEQIKRCAILLSPQWTKKSIDLTADLESATYLGNADLMQHVWINIIANAIKFTPEHGTIRLRLKKDRHGMLIAEVTDNGKGMTEEELAHAFEKYYQGSPKQASWGLGLGLAIAKRIVVLAEGRIEASSVSGEGSTIRVSLPAQQQRK